MSSPEESCKTWKKTDLCFGKWQELGKFPPGHLKVSKLNFNEILCSK